MSAIRVAVIGAGAAGLVALRHLTAIPDVFQATAFEQTPTVGGTWVYTDDVGTTTDGLTIHSSMYKNLRTNLPKEVMAFPDFPFSDELPSFIKHEDVLDYLKKYAEHFNLLPYVQFSTHVERIHPLDSEARGAVKWQVSVRHLKTNVTTVNEFDAVMVCNGHNAVPYYPEELKLADFNGSVIHSHDYREPEPFQGRPVIILGAGPSGVDIAIEISPLVDQLYLCHKDNRIPSAALPSNVVQKSGIRTMTSMGAILDDGEHLDADALILCTGYRYTFPFLDADSCQLNVRDHMVTPLYRHVIHARLPTMSFVGIPQQICPFPLFDRQVRFVLAQLRGTARLPDVGDLEEEVRESMRRYDDIGRPFGAFHSMRDGAQWRYNDALAEMAGFEPLAPCVQRLYEHVWRTRKQGLATYKQRNYRICDRDSFVEL